MKVAQWKAQATVERARVERCVNTVDDKATISLGRFGIIGHPAITDDESICNVVSLWDEHKGCFKAIGLAGGAERAGPRLQGLV